MPPEHLREDVFRHVVPEGDPRKDPPHAGDMISRGWLLNASLP